jgi:hypothetical protein
VAECTPGTTRITSDGTRELCVGGMWVPIAEPIREAPSPGVFVVESSGALRALAEDPDIARLLEDTNTHLVISVEHVDDHAAEHHAGEPESAGEADTVS